MHAGTICERQRTLFSKGLAWQELPREVCEEAISMFATLCVEIMMEIPSAIQEQDHESSSD